MVGPRRKKKLKWEKENGEREMEEERDGGYMWE